MGIKYRDNGQIKEVSIKVGDNIPVGAELDFDGQIVPPGYEEVDDPNVYSTTETKIGTWIDGKPLYRLVFQGTTGSTAEQDISVGNVSSANIDRLIKCDGVLHGTEQLSANYYYTSNNYGCLYFNNSNKNVYCKQTKYLSKPISVILEYTKTTD